MFLYDNFFSLCTIIWHFCHPNKTTGGGGLHPAKRNDLLAVLKNYMPNRKCMFNINSDKTKRGDEQQLEFREYF